MLRQVRRSVGRCAAKYSYLAVQALAVQRLRIAIRRENYSDATRAKSRVCLTAGGNCDGGGGGGGVGGGGGSGVEGGGGGVGRGGGGDGLTGEVMHLRRQKPPADAHELLCIEHGKR